MQIACLSILWSLAAVCTGVVQEAGVVRDSGVEARPAAQAADTAVVFDPAASSESNATGFCPGFGSCCVGHKGLGCSDTACCEIVCRVRGECCSVGWTLDCALAALSLCDGTCAGACPMDGSCCEPRSDTGGCSDVLCCDLVCNHTPSCCETAWSQECVDLAGVICDTCDPPPDCPQPGDCCANHAPGTGCETELCCQIVCDLDPFCCRGEWDGPCARKARENCPNICLCDTFGDFDLSATVDLFDVASFFTCFTGAGNGPVAAGCECGDYDADGDSDLVDFAALKALLGP